MGSGLGEVELHTFSQTKIQNELDFFLLFHDAQIHSHGNGQFHLDLKQSLHQM